MLSFNALANPLAPEWDLIAGADTGTYMSAVICAVPPGDFAQIVCLAEVPNYRYVSNEIELLGMSVPEWARIVYGMLKKLRPGTEHFNLWADPNTQFRAELQHYGLNLLGNLRGPELRCEITREYMQSVDPVRLHLAPWLSVLPYEIEHAKWPEDTTSAGKFMRIKHHDHTLDPLEHCCSRRPRSEEIINERKKSFLEQQLEQMGRFDRTHHSDPHLGRL